jgi:hypothetical protein
LGEDFIGRQNHDWKSPNKTCHPFANAERVRDVPHPPKLEPGGGGRID